jgi:hypothetical protein
VESYYQLGFACHLAKPFERKELCSNILALVPNNKKPSH